MLYTSVSILYPQHSFLYYVKAPWWCCQESSCRPDIRHSLFVLQKAFLPVFLPMSPVTPALTDDMSTDSQTTRVRDWVYYHSLPNHKKTDMQFSSTYFLGLLLLTVSSILLLESFISIHLCTLKGSTETGRARTTPLLTLNQLDWGLVSLRSIGLALGRQRPSHSKADAPCWSISNSLCYLIPSTL